jgi:hypothetical protein
MERIIRTHVRFRSGLFNPLEPEEQQTNPGVYGEELSKWIFDNLPHHGMKTTEWVAEDWGRVVNLESRKFPVWIGCSNEGWKVQARMRYVSSGRNEKQTELCVLRRWMLRVCLKIASSTHRASSPRT